ncbi:hypothetical protein MYCTH_2296120 [Thermothelomyces thermophilus ATCC 42464]|uniref:Uncharacterized protein n=1 Tax=Thermothelomyces thermophilus (strain ATCC 42464 / BCRC 31852 / DSM 1799) TaxID=573729 RepID=G2Q0I4_THET4|nr:uncharacterized protein MYCTH_2296120 [Thermothelomyces thermophilus ATCC 42464]AEO54045.1 hypothetical protein MYCTH_2296120 [Thermothelomyces thermophilus ATCC 42464]
MGCFLRMLSMLIFFAAATALAAPAMDSHQPANRHAIRSLSGAEAARTADNKTRAAGESGKMADRDIIPGVLTALDDTAHRASIARRPSPPGDAADNDVVDDFERLLQVIAGHVDRMRQQSSRADDDNNDTDDTTANGGGGGGPGRVEAAPSPALAPAPVVINYDAMFPDRAPPAQGWSSQHKGDNADDGGGGDGSGNTNFNITCKGISVCNPVTVVNGGVRGGGSRRIRLDRFGSRARAAWRRKKAEKQQRLKTQRKQEGAT